MTGPWTLADLRAGRVGEKANNLNVFSCFHCGGGSSMGYKLAGFNVLGGVEIDHDMMRLYRKNIAPDLGYSFLMGVEEFKNIPDSELPRDIFEIDILDGSPPCSSFSMAGSREDAWGKKKKFREGQAVQVLDDLFFHFIDIARKLRPKVVVAENVKGMLMGNARGYVKMVLDQLDDAGYDVQLFLLNSNSMGVPQSRERIFFIARRKDLKLQKITLDFTEPKISVTEAWKGLTVNLANTTLSPRAEGLWRRCRPGESFGKHNDGSWFNWVRLAPNKPSPTVPATCRHTHPTEPRFLSYEEVVRLQSFPDDYDFDTLDARYVCGMSVPPLMMARVASEVRAQIFGMAPA